MKPSIISPSLSLFLLRLTSPALPGFPSMSSASALCRACCVICPWCPCAGEPQNEQRSLQFHKRGWQRSNHVPWSAGYILPNALAQCEGGIIGQKGKFVFNLLSTEPWRTFLLSLSSWPQSAWLQRVIPSQLQDFTFAYVECMRVLSANSSSLSRSLGRAALHHLNHFPTVWYHPQICWECTLFHHPGFF